MHHLRILTYPPSLIDTLKKGEVLENGAREEVSLRAGSVVGVGRVREEIVSMRRARNLEKAKEGEGKEEEEVSSVLIDFYLWDLAKRVERGEESVGGEGSEEEGGSGTVGTEEIVPCHRTRSIWY